MLRLPLTLSLAFLFACDGSANPADGKDDKDDTSVIDGAGDEDGDGFLVSEGDCDDANSDVHPSATEICNGVDDNCDSDIDEGVEGTYYQDFDGDGFGDGNVSVTACDAPSGYVESGTDCDDSERDSFPGATETCDEIDNDCDGDIDEGVTSSWYADADGDGFGDAAAVTDGCEQPSGSVEDNTDCDDTTDNAYPGNAEVCDEVDNNCDGTVDEGVTTTYYADFDEDEFGAAGLTQEACSVPTGYTINFADCDDSTAAVNPDATEICNTIDDNCDGVIDTDATDRLTWYADTDGDTYGSASSPLLSCTASSGYVADATDCDDTRALSNPAATEYCNTYDDNCDGTVDETSSVDAATWYLDADSDTYGNAAVSSVSCSQPSGYVADSTDCNDGTSRARPGAPEYCDYIDNDCDAAVDEDSSVDAPAWYADADADLFGNSAVTDVECYQPSGYVADATDCNDARAASYPGAPEYCNAYDDDCDGSVDEDSALDASTWYADTDADAYGDRTVTTVACYLPAGHVADYTDCDDARALTNPGATEYCNSIDDDCDGTIDEDLAADAITWYRDVDADGYGDPAVSDVSCSPPSGYVPDNTDCIDTSGISHPGASEICDSLDNDCDGTADDSPTDGNTYYADDDSDGFGDPAATTSECELPSGYSENAYDCNDASFSEPVVADAVTGSGSGAGTLANPFDSLQDAIDNANECVVAYAGTYLERIDLDSKSIDVWGVEGQEITTIDANLSTCTTANPTACGATVTVASGTNATPTLHGFTITGGTGSYTSSTATTTCADSSASHSGRTSCSVTTYEYCGGGVYANGDDPNFYDVIIRDNTLPGFEQTSVGGYTQYWMYSFGGAVCLQGSNATFTTSVIEGNYADQGGGIFAEASSYFTFDEGYVGENSATDGGGVLLSGASAAFSNAIVGCNSAETDGGGLFTESSGASTFTNTVFFGNTSSISGSARGSQAYIGASTTFNLYSSIAQSDTAAYAIYGAGGSGSQDYNNVYNTETLAYGGTLAAGTGAVSSGGNFTSAACDGNVYNDNFSLRSSSGSIDAGNPSSSLNDADGTRNDQGAFGGPGSVWSL
ncbi:MAG: putative metal-binding motif-containing protein [Pseudomonadota bacterium]|nr:putative metal-binding motif-containing protein [Pseudomonadota bacterium]